ncbi:MAG: autotransporter domain-containing protein [Deltaproteobacteria bacterium]|nr:autotransporter domain-containing protein [Deltaproteobacteria bacterium]
MAAWLAVVLALPAASAQNLVMTSSDDETVEPLSVSGDLIAYGGTLTVSSAGAASAAANNMYIYGGTALFSGQTGLTVSTGELRLYGGINSFISDQASALTLASMSVNDGRNAINGGSGYPATITVANDLIISGGTNNFDGDFKVSGDIKISGGIINNIADLTIVNIGSVELSGGRNNIGVINANSSVKISDGDNVISLVNGSGAFVSMTGGNNYLDSIITNNAVRIADGSNSIGIVSGSEVLVDIAGGSNSFEMIFANNSIKISDGNNNIETINGSGALVDISGGINSLDLIVTDNQIKISGGSNTIDNISGVKASVDVSGGSNAFVKDILGAAVGGISLSGGNNAFNNIVEVELVNISDGLNSVYGSAEADSLKISGGTNVFIDNVTAAVSFDVSGGNNTFSGNITGDNAVFKDSANTFNGSNQKFDYSGTAISGSNATFSISGAGFSTDKTIELADSSKIYLISGGNSFGNLTLADGLISACGGSNSYVNISAETLIFEGGSNTVAGTADIGALHLAGGNNTFNEAVEAANTVNVTDGLNAYKSSLSAENIYFRGGTNEIDGSIASAAYFLASSAAVTVNGPTTADDLDIRKGENAFKGSLTASGLVNVTGGNNSYANVSASAFSLEGGNNAVEGTAEVGTLQLAGGNNTFKEDIEASAAISVTGGTNAYEKSLKAADIYLQAGETEVLGDVLSTGYFLVNSTATVINGLTTANDLDIRKGENAFKGSLTASGLVSVTGGNNSYANVSASAFSLEGGDNAVDGTAEVGTLHLAGGNNTFKEDIEASAAINVTGGTNAYGKSLKAADIYLQADEAEVLGDVISTGYFLMNSTVTAINGLTTANDLDIRKGENTFKGNLTASGQVSVTGGNNSYANVSALTLNLEGGDNAVDGIVEVGTLQLTGGNNIFKESVEASAAINVTGGNNIYENSLMSNDICFQAGQVQVEGDITSRDYFLINNSVTAINGLTDVNDLDIKKGKNTFNDDLLASGSVNVTGGANRFNGNISASELSFDSSDNYFTVTGQSIMSDNDIKSTNSNFYFNENTDLHFNQGFILDRLSKISLTGHSKISFAGSNGLTVGGRLSLAAHQLLVDGDFIFGDQAVMVISKSASDLSQTGSQGRLTVTGSLTTNGSVKIDANFNNLPDDSQPLITAGTSVANYFDSFFSEFFTLILGNEGKSIYIDNFLLAGIGNGSGNNSNDTWFDNIIKNSSGNGHKLVNLITALEYQAKEDKSKFEDNGPLWPLFEGIFKAWNYHYQLAVNSGNTDIFKRFLVQNSGELLLNAFYPTEDFASKVQKAVYSRLDGLRGAITLSDPPSFGDSDFNSRLWVNFIGSWSKQKNHNSVYGFDYNGRGINLGYDYMVESVPSLTLGFNGSLSSGEVKSNAGYASIDVDSIDFGLYGSYIFDNGFFLDAAVDYGKSKNESKIQAYGGSKLANFDLSYWQFGVRTGLVLAYGDFRITPSVGLRYLSAHQKAFSEKFSGSPFAIRNFFENKKDKTLEIPVQVKVNADLSVGEAQILPELRLGVVMTAKKPDSKLNVGLIGYDSRMTINGIKASSPKFQAGAGVQVKVMDNLNVFVNYDLDAASGYVSHNAAIGLEFSF